MKDLIILGNGMAGMTAALYAKRANLDFKIVGKDEFDFGQIGNAILVENYPCVESQSGYDLAMKLYNQLENNEIHIEENSVSSLETAKDEKGHNIWKINYENSTYEYAKTIIYALGANYRELSCEIEEDVIIHNCALCDGSLYKNKVVAIIGGGDVAFTQAEYLSNICAEVKIVMCDTNITANKSLVERVEKLENVDIYFNCPIDSIKHDKELNRNILYSNENKIIADGIFVAIGMIPNTKPIDNLHITDSNGYIIAGEDCSTLSWGLFVAGDVRTKKVRQSITAAADGAISVQSAINYLKNVRTTDYIKNIRS